MARLTEEEKKYIFENKDTKTIQDIADILNKSYDTVYRVIYRSRTTFKRATTYKKRNQKKEIQKTKLKFNEVSKLAKDEGLSYGKYVLKYGL